MAEPITLDQLKHSLPANLRTFATEGLVERLNEITTDPLIAEDIKRNFLSYTHILREGKFKTESYLDAVAYVSFKLMGYTNQDAYFRTFPNRYAELVAKGRSSKDIAAYVAAFHRNKLVNLIMEQSLIPSWILNQDAYQEAINTQVDLMRNSKSDRVRAMAADSLLNHLAKPETKEPLINIDLREGSGLDELKKNIAELARTQKELIAGGVAPKAILDQKLYVKEAEDAEVVNE